MSAKINIEDFQFARKNKQTRNKNKNQIKHLES